MDEVKMLIDRSLNLVVYPDESDPINQLRISTSHQPIPLITYEDYKKFTQGKEPKNLLDTEEDILWS